MPALLANSIKGRYQRLPEWPVEWSESGSGNMRNDCKFSKDNKVCVWLWRASLAVVVLPGGVPLNWILAIGSESETQAPSV